ncbi:hypothetical protein B0T17DRAFT_503079 [Bombardia bombarda]|uniref:Uncharacterized protein n=1 Tax=Bombardia bombarda TaxID=252184 RepID=A0AA40CFI7_9PEZI|nr:hypothetical protein B0T17DRAFT_503079 [Bombardia bombarda]
MTALVRALAAGWLLTSAAAAAHERFQAVETGAVLSPRYYFASPPQVLGKRQSQCGANSHPCDDLGVAGNGVCCPDTQYCIINTENLSTVKCCAIGSDCDSPCSANRYECVQTSTLTASGTVTTSTSTGCCPRCISTVTPSTATTIVSAIPSGCTTSQFECPVSLGGGCCAVTQSCTQINSTAHCAEATITPTGTGVTVVTTDTGLSAGAKAGISVGVIVICGLIIGAVTWWCIRKRKGRSVAPSSSYRPRPTVGAVVGGGREMSEATSDVVSRGGPLPGMVHDYFGPEAAFGPYSETQIPSNGTTPGGDRDRGVPIRPHDPSDIAVPVEIDSRVKTDQPEQAPPEQQQTSNGTVTTVFPSPQSEHDVEGRFELYGWSPSDELSPYVPSPYSAIPHTSPEERPRFGIGGEGRPR